MFLCPHCLGPATTCQTINQIEASGQVIYRMRYCKKCDLKIKTKEEAIETIYYVRRVNHNAEEEDT